MSDKDSVLRVSQSTEIAMIGENQQLVTDESVEK